MAYQDPNFFKKGVERMGYPMRQDETGEIKGDLRVSNLVDELEKAARSITDRIDRLEEVLSPVLRNNMHLDLSEKAQNPGVTPEHPSLLLVLLAVLESLEYQAGRLDHMGDRLAL